MKRANNAERILIFTGGNLGKWALKEIAAGDFLLGVDRGSLFLLRNNFQPQFAIGDFDSVTPQEFKEIQNRSLEVVDCDPVLKDYTDTEMAFNWAVEQNPREIILLGALGSRFDHSLANVHLLLKGLNQGIVCRIIDEKNEIKLTNSVLTVSKSRFTYTSLLPLSQKVTGISLEGFQYPLANATLVMGQSLGISNLLQGETGQISVKKGYLLVVQSMD